MSQTVTLGLVGLGDRWETHYRPACERMGGRLHVALVYDAVQQRAKAAAGHRNGREETHSATRAVAGVRTLCESSHIDAVLCLDVGWAGSDLLRFLCSQPKPIYLGVPFGDDPDLLDELRTRSRADGLTQMPEFAPRYTPAGNRLQELIATRLGLVRELHLALPAAEIGMNGEASAGVTSWVPRLDWCSYLIRSTPIRIHPAGGQNGEARTVQIEYRSRGEAQPTRVFLTQVDMGAKQPSARIDCERGSARILADDRLAWRDEQGEHEEFLDGDRSAEQVLLDLFCRRVVGGLISVADLDDAYRATHLANAVREVFRTGESIEL